MRLGCCSGCVPGSFSGDAVPCTNSGGKVRMESQSAGGRVARDSVTLSLLGDAAACHFRPRGMRFRVQVLSESRFCAKYLLGRCSSVYEFRWKSAHGIAKREWESGTRYRATFAPAKCDCVPLSHPINAVPCTSPSPHIPHQRSSAKEPLPPSRGAAPVTVAEKTGTATTIGHPILSSVESRSLELE